jgi:hypothetical protein
MTVKELKDLLATMPDELPVYFNNRHELYNEEREINGVTLEERDVYHRNLGMINIVLID